MAIDETLLAAIGPLFSNRFYPDAAPAGTAKPYATYSQVGGSSVNPIKGTNPGIENSRIQINVWATTRIQARSLMQSIVNTIRPNPIAATPIGAPIARYDDTNELRGMQQDFDIWWS